MLSFCWRSSLAEARERRRKPWQTLQLVALVLLSLPSAAGASELTITPSDDARVQEWCPDCRYGSSNTLRVANYGDQLRANSFLKFKVDGAGAVTNAKLRVYATNPADGPTAHTADNSWDETSISWSNSPSLGRELSQAPAWHNTGTWVEFDVSDAVKGDGTYSFALAGPPDTSNGWYEPKEKTAGHPPELTLTTSDTPTGEDCPRPYTSTSAWNSPVGPSPEVDPRSSSLIQAIADNGLPLTSDPDQYTPAVYTFDEETPLRPITLGWYSSYDAGDNSRVGHGWGSTQQLPIPDDAQPPEGSDGQVVLWNPKTGVEYGLWQFERDAEGNLSASNGYRYHTSAGYHGRFADARAGRGAGLPYLGGLVRPCEVAQGHIDHALAFAYDSPSSAFVFPASKSDGAGVLGTDLPEGTRLQLNPELTDADLDALQLSPAAKTIARALQTYGMYVVDNSGSSKIYLEARHTANWDHTIDRDLLETIPWSEFQVVGIPRAD